MRHPILRARLLPDKHGYLLFVPDDSCPEVILAEGDEGVLRSKVEIPLDPSRAVSRLISVRGEDEGFVGLQTDHSVFDAINIWAFLSELWETYAELLKGATNHPKFSVDLPRSPCEILDERWPGFLQQKNPEKGNALPLEDCESSASTVEEATGTLRRNRLRLSQPQTASLIEAARRSECSVNQLISGILLAAHRNLLGDLGVSPLRCHNAVNLRYRMSPVVGPTETTSFVANHVSDFAAPYLAEPMGLAHAMASDFRRAAAARGFTLIPDVTSAYSFDPTAVISVTNAGKAPRFVNMPNVDAVDLLIFAEHVAHPHPLYGVLYVAYTFNGELNLVAHANHKSIAENTFANLAREVNAAVDSVTSTAN